MTAAATPGAFADRVFQSALGAIEIFSIHVGDRLGFYRALASHEAATAADVAGATGAHERYVREWLEQQAAFGLVDVDLSGDPPRFSLPPTHAPVLIDSLNPSYLAPLARMLVAAGVQMPALLEAYCNGSGVSWSDFGMEMRQSQADMNRPFFHHGLAEGIAAVPELDEVLRRPGPVRVADVGCGAGWSAIAIATAYPSATVDGFDIDTPSVEMARAHAAGSGVADRVAFEAVDVATLDDRGDYDAVFAFECVHDMPQPVGVLAAMRHMVRDDGVVVVMDEAVGDRFEGVADEVERLMYGFSLLVCLPDGMSSQPSVGTGTVIRPGILRAYAREAGFSDISVLPIDGGFWRFYRLHL